MELGNVAEWVGAVGTVGALIAAVLLLRKELRSLEADRVVKADEQKARAEEREMQRRNATTTWCAEFNGEAMLKYRIEAWIALTDQTKPRVTWEDESFWEKLGKNFPPDTAEYRAIAIVLRKCGQLEHLLASEQADPELIDAGTQFSLTSIERLFDPDEEASDAHTGGQRDTPIPALRSLASRLDTAVDGAGQAAVS